jgi:hypothetical protein
LSSDGFQRVEDRVWETVLRARVPLAIVFTKATGEEDEDAVVEQVRGVVEAMAARVAVETSMAPMRVFVGVVNSRVRRFLQLRVVIPVFGYVKEHEGERDGVCDFLNEAVTLGRADAAERARMVNELLDREQIRDAERFIEELASECGGYAGWWTGMNENSSSSAPGARVSLVEGVVRGIATAVNEAPLEIPAQGLASARLFKSSYVREPCSIVRTIVLLLGIEIDDHCAKRVISACNTKCYKASFLRWLGISLVSWIAPKLTAPMRARILGQSALELIQDVAIAKRPAAGRVRLTPEDFARV